MRKLCFLFTIAVLLSPARGWAQGVGNWSLGANYGFEVPIKIFSQWHEETRKTTARFSYMTAPKVGIEVEYQRSSYTNGKLQAKTFVWPVDGKSYRSPEAQSTMVINTLVVNGVLYLKEGGLQLATKMWAPYFVAGTGFYDYKSRVSGMIYPGQRSEVAPGAGLDPTLHLEPFTDSRVSLGLNLGFGLEAFIFEGAY